MSKKMNVPVSTLKAHPRNAEIYGEVTADEKLIDSINVSGLIAPICVTTPDEEGMRTIVSGHRRWDAVKRLGIVDVDVLEDEYENDKAIELALVGSNQTREKTQEDVANEFKVLSGIKDLLGSEEYDESWNELGTEFLAQRLGRSTRYVRDLEYIYKPSVRDKAIKRLERAGGTEADINEIVSYWDQIRAKHSAKELGLSPAVDALKGYNKRRQKQIAQSHGMKHKDDAKPEKKMAIETVHYNVQEDGFMPTGSVNIRGEIYTVGLLQPRGVPVQVPAMNLTPKGSKDAPEIEVISWTDVYDMLTSLSVLD